MSNVLEEGVFIVYNLTPLDCFDFNVMYWK